jgi:hypothetical protein
MNRAQIIDAIMNIQNSRLAITLRLINNRGQGGVGPTATAGLVEYQGSRCE